VSRMYSLLGGRHQVTHRIGEAEYHHRQGASLLLRYSVQFEAEPLVSKLVEGSIMPLIASPGCGRTPSDPSI